MNKIPAREIVKDIRSGLDDDQLIEKYRLSRKGLQRVLRRLVNDRLIRHEELYHKSAAYRRIADLLASRRSPRLYVPVAIRIYRDGTGQKGFIRDISDHGIRVAGIPASPGEEVTFSLPLTEIDSIGPLRFDAVCRWTRMEGRRTKYPVGGFEITMLSDEARSQLGEMRDLIFAQTQGEERRRYTPLNIPEMLRSATEMRVETEARDFSGTVDNVDILDFVQFMLLVRKKAVLHVQSYWEGEGRLYLDGGRIVHAVTGEIVGKEAFIQCMNFHGGVFSTNPWQEPPKRSINAPGDFLLIEAARLRDELLDESEEDDIEDW